MKIASNIAKNLISMLLFVCVTYKRFSVHSENFKRNLKPYSHDEAVYSTHYHVQRNTCFIWFKEL